MCLTHSDPEARQLVDVCFNENRLNIILTKEEWTGTVTVVYSNDHLLNTGKKVQLRETIGSNK